MPHQIRSSNTVVNMLKAAKVTQETSKRPLPTTPNKFPVAEVSRIAVWPGPQPKHGCFVLVSGEAVLGVSIPPNVLRSLAADLIKLADAGDGRPQQNARTKKIKSKKK